MENNQRLRLRVFHISDDLALRLSNRAHGQGIALNILARQFIDEYIKQQKFVYIAEDKRTVLRSYHLTVEQDEALAGIAFKFRTTKGKIFRSAIAQGLGI